MPEDRIKVAPKTIAYADQKQHTLVVEFAIPGAPQALAWPVKPDRAEAIYAHGVAIKAGGAKTKTKRIEA